MKPTVVDPSQFAALDLGSNSFHLLIAKETAHGFTTLDRVKDMVRLAEGLDENGELSAVACERALESLAKFQQRLRSVPTDHVRVVGTSALRRTRGANYFIHQAENTLQHKIEVVSGREEARLIYLGARHTLAPTDTQRLIIDVGGGSTELILGNQSEPLLLESLDIGCVDIMQQCFIDNKISQKNLNAARLVVGLELEPYLTQFHRRGWDQAVGTSGTLAAIDHVLNFGSHPTGTIQYQALSDLVTSLKRQQAANQIQLPGLSNRRSPVFLGGCVIVLNLMTLLEIDKIEVTDGALREGILIDLLGRHHHHDVRDLSIHALAKRFQVDESQSAAVSECAFKLYQACAEPWNIVSDDCQQLLKWACEVHEIGMAISHSQHHHHGSNILAAADLPGFSKNDQYLLSLLVRFHRRAIKGEQVASLHQEQFSSLAQLIALLRISVQLNRGRSFRDLQLIRVEAKTDKITLQFQRGWLKDHPLTHEDLKQEKDALEKLGIALVLNEY